MPQQHVISEKKFSVQFFNNAVSDQPEVVVDVFDYIDDWWGWGINRLALALYGHTGAIRVRVNSYGGDLLQGLAIMNLLRAHPGDVTVEVMGIAASAATFVVAGANKVVMREGSFLMIHNPFTLAIGTSDEMQSTADALGKMENEMANVYLSGMRKRKKYEDLTDEKAIAKIRDWMNSETWFTSAEAVENGFADEVDKGAQADTDAAIQTAAAASNETAIQYRNTPQRVLNLISAHTKKTDIMAKEKNVLEKIMDILSPIKAEEAAILTPAEETEAYEDNPEADVLEAARKALESAGYTVTEGEPAESAQDDPDARTFTEEEVEAMVVKAIEASNAKKAAAKSPIIQKPSGNKSNKVDNLREKAMPAFDALAQMVRGR
jgi:ATP-dependent Clp protease protease subunit